MAKMRAGPPATPSPLKWHGGKHYLAPKIVALMPPHTHYVEPYFGGGSVLLAKDPEGVSEVANDRNRWLTAFWRVLQRPDYFAEFRRRMEATPFSEQEWDTARSYMGDCGSACWEDPVMAACWFFVACRQSLAGRMEDFAPLTRNRTRRGMNEQASAWMTCVDGLPEVHARVRLVVVLDKDALDVIKDQDGPKTLFYCDPPYLHETRAAKGVYGEYEMRRDGHERLLAALGKIEGKFLLSGYRSFLYDAEAARHGWNRHDFELPNNAAGGKKKRRMKECVWCNF
jgi:DNA adenine methylase